LAACIALAPAAIAQGVADPLSPRLSIEEIAPPSVEVVGSDLRLLANSSSPVGLVGDQVFSSIASTGINGFVAWQDNAIDGNGLGIGARFLNLQTGISSPQIVRVNQDTLFNQEKPRVAALANGGAIVVWQSGKIGHQSIRARLLSRTGSVTGTELHIADADAASGFYNPVVAASGNGFAVAWEAAGPDGVSRKIHFQRFSANGAADGGVRILGTSGRVDRRPTLASHADGTVVVAWVAEMAQADVLGLGGVGTRSEVNSDIFAQIIQPGGQVGQLIWLNGASRPCDAPAIAALSSGRTLVGWSEFATDGTSGWDIRTAVLDAAGTLPASPSTLNTYRSFEQIGLTFAVNGNDTLAVWNSRGADGSGLGASARALDQFGSPRGDKFVANTQRTADQTDPAVAATPQGFRVIWSALGSLATGVDLKARDVKKLTGSSIRSIKLSWNSVPGEPYLLESSTNLETWTPLQSVSAASSSQQSTSLDAASPTTFYRVKLDR
jgi:hypothetical protein